VPTTIGGHNGSTTTAFRCDGEKQRGDVSREYPDPWIASGLQCGGPERRHSGENADKIALTPLGDRANSELPVARIMTAKVEPLSHSVAEMFLFG